MYPVAIRCARALYFLGGAAGCVTHRCFSVVTMCQSIAYVPVMLGFSHTQNSIGPGWSEPVVMDYYTCGGSWTTCDNPVYWVISPDIEHVGGALNRWSSNPKPVRAWSIYHRIGPENGQILSSLGSNR